MSQSVSEGGPHGHTGEVKVVADNNSYRKAQFVLSFIQNEPAGLMKTPRSTMISIIQGAG